MSPVDAGVFKTLLEWGHITIKVFVHPHFGTRVVLNGHEYVASQEDKQGLVFTKDGNCFTQVQDVAGLAMAADTSSDPRTIGRLSQLCDRWIYARAASKIITRRTSSLAGHLAVIVAWDRPLGS